MFQTTESRKRVSEIRGKNDPNPHIDIQARGFGGKLLWNDHIPLRPIILR